MESALKMGFQTSHLWCVMSTRGFNIWIKLLIRQQKVCLEFIASCDPIRFLLSLMAQRDFKNFWCPGGREDLSYPGSEYILVHGKRVNLVMKANFSQVHSNLNASV